jgi:predicted small metal-binding protein
MFADKALRCDCGYEVQASDEATCVHEVQEHASEAHGIDLPDDVALNLVQRARLVSHGEQETTREEKR